MESSTTTSQSQTPKVTLAGAAKIPKLAYVKMNRKQTMLLEQIKNGVNTQAAAAAFESYTGKLSPQRTLAVPVDLKKRSILKSLRRLANTFKLKRDLSEDTLSLEEAEANWEHALEGLDDLWDSEDQLMVVDLTDEENLRELYRLRWSSALAPLRTLWDTRKEIIKVDFRDC